MGLAGGRSVSIKGTRAGVITPRGVLPLSEMNSGLDQRFNHPPFLHPAAPNAHIIIWAVTAPSSPLTMPIVSNLCGHKTDFFPLPRGVGTVKEYCGLPKGFAFLGDWRPRFHTQKPVATCYDRSSSCPSPFLFPSPLKTLICFNSWCTVTFPEGQMRADTNTTHLPFAPIFIIAITLGEWPTSANRTHACSWHRKWHVRAA